MMTKHTLIINQKNREINAQIQKEKKDLITTFDSTISALLLNMTVVPDSTSETGYSLHSVWNGQTCRLLFSGSSFKSKKPMNVVIFATDHVPSTNFVIETSDKAEDLTSYFYFGPGIEQYATFEDAMFRLFLSKLSLVEQVFVREKQKTNFRQYVGKQKTRA